MELLQSTTYPRMLALTAFSLAVHVGTLLLLGKVPTRSAPPVYEKVKVQVVAKPQAEPLPPPQPAPTPPPQQQRSPKRTTPAQAEPTPAPPVLGLSPESLDKTGKGKFAVPAGNTTDAPDTGQRLTPEQVQGLGKNLSRDAELIVSTFDSPVYTEAAEDAGLEGLYVVEVYVDPQGKVSDAELRSKIGYGMDERVLEAVRKARFNPRLDPLGKPLAGWTDIKVRLTIK